MNVGMEFNLIFDVLIAILLVATIAYAAVLNRKLGALRDAKSEMEALFASFSESTERAGSGVEMLKQEAGRSGEALHNKVAAARGLADDLSFLIERGTKLADRLDGGSGAVRAKPVAAKAETGAVRAKSSPRESVSDAVAGAGPGEAATAESVSADLSAAESELLKALQGMR